MSSSQSQPSADKGPQPCSPQPSGYLRREVIGDAVLLLGDCREILPSLGPVGAVVTDPPYGRAFKSGWTGSEIANDGDTTARDDVLLALRGVPAIVFGDAKLPAAPGSVATLIWHRPGSGMGDLAFPWKPDYEHIFVLGDGFAHQTRGPSVLAYPWDVFRGDAVHPHQKPIALMVSLIERCPPGTILDPFMGSGSTGVACVRLGRPFVGIELDEAHFATACRRIEEAYRQPRLFDEPTTPAPKQGSIFDGEAA